jgi:hypothetical protein
MMPPATRMDTCGVLCVGCNLLNAEGKSFLLAIANATRDTPKIEVSRTLAVAIIPPRETM